MTHTIRVNVNGVAVERAVESRLLLVHFLRESCGLTGTHVGCDTSLCGACTVLLDGRAVKSCTVFAVQCDGRQVATVESLAQGETLHLLQDAFRECHGLQCGFCTPGMLMTSMQILDRPTAPARHEIVHSLKGNLCRCTGYTHIIDAIEQAGRQRAGGR
jgi:carbon-monoxide dehydrogenase small subunit